MDGSNARRSPGPDDVVVIYYSRTGTTATVAEAVVDRLDSPVVRRIRPRHERSYRNWLARSFLPGSTVEIEPIETDLREARAVFLGTPKWTLSCPPVTAYLRQVAFAETPVGLFLTYGGFDQRRYARALTDRLDDRGADVRARLLVQRDAVGSAAFGEGVETVRDRVLDRPVTR